jgi:hypothetical protein
VSRIFEWPGNLNSIWYSIYLFIYGFLSVCVYFVSVLSCV